MQLIIDKKTDDITIFLGLINLLFSTKVWPVSLILDLPLGLKARLMILGYGLLSNHLVLPWQMIKIPRVVMTYNDCER